jgi:hypothetical protein
MAVVAGHLHAVRELRTEPRARLLLAGKRLELDVFVAGIFSEARQAGVGGFCGVHAGEWGRAGRSAERGAAGVLRLKKLELADGRYAGIVLLLRVLPGRDL